MDSTSILYVNVILLLLLIVFSVNQRCSLPPMSQLEGITQLGDIMIGALLGIHVDKIYQKLTFSVTPPRTACTSFSLEFYHQLQTVIHTIEKINRDPNILSNVTLGFQMYDTCNIPHYELQGALQFLAGLTTLKSNIQCNSRKTISAVIGSRVSANSIILANVLGTFRYPQISPYSSVSLLSNQKKFPSFFRTMSSDKWQSMGLAQLVLSYGWTWIGLVATDNDYGLLGIQPIKEEIIKAGACVAFTEYIRLGQPNLNAPHIVKVMKESTAKVIIAFSFEVDFVIIVDEMLKQNITGRIFIANAGWSRSILLSMKKYFPVISGTLGLVSVDYEVPGLSQFLSKTPSSEYMVGEWVELYWETIFNCQFNDGKNLSGSLVTTVKECTGKEHIDDVKNSFTYTSSLKYSYTTYSSVSVLAKALDDLKNCKEGEGPFTHGSCADIRNFKPWQLVHYIRKVRLFLSSDIYFDKNGDPPAVYSIVNWQLSPDGTVKQVNIGNYRTAAPPGQDLTINASLIRWPTEQQIIIEDGINELTDYVLVIFLLDMYNTHKEFEKVTYIPQLPRSVCSESCPPGFRKAARTGQPVCCFDCVQCLQGEISKQTDSLTCQKCPLDKWPNLQKTECLQKTTEYLKYEDPLGKALTTSNIMSSFVPVSILMLFIYSKDTPIVKANNYSISCLLLLSLSLCFLCSLVFIGYPQSVNCLLRQAAFGLSFTLCISCILAKTIMVVFAFMATRPGSGLRKWTTPQVSYMIIFSCFLLQFLVCITWLVLDPPFPQMNTQTKPGIIIVECNEGFSFAFWIMLGYLFLLATISFMVAFLARRLPDSFNEAQYITFSMLAFLSVWVSFIPASLSAQGKYTVAMEIFAILVSSWAIIICIFFPKCLIIVLRPDLNSREYIMRKERQ